MICELKSNGSRGCGGVMLAGRHYVGTSYQTGDAEAAVATVSYHCPSCGNHVDATIERNRRAHQFLPVIVPPSAPRVGQPATRLPYWERLRPESVEEALGLHALTQDIDSTLTEEVAS